MKGEEKGNEIILTNKCVVEASKRKFDVEKPVKKTTIMEKLGDLSVGQGVVVHVKEVKVGEIQKVASKKKGTELRKVDCVVVDSSGGGCIYSVVGRRCLEVGIALFPGPL